MDTSSTVVVGKLPKAGYKRDSEEEGGRTKSAIVLGVPYSFSGRESARRLVAHKRDPECGCKELILCTGPTTPPLVIFKFMAGDYHEMVIMCTEKRDGVSAL